MKHEFKQKVFYSDTDAYGVVWHGSYLRWLEMGRIELCEKAGYSLTKLYDANITLPVVDLNVRYKSPAKLEEEAVSELVQKFKELIEKNAKLDKVDEEKSNQVTNDSENKNDEDLNVLLKQLTKYLENK